MSDHSENGAAAGHGRGPASDNPVPTIATGPAGQAPAAPAPPLPTSPFTLPPLVRQPPLRRWLRSRTGLVALSLVALATLLLVVDHWLHLVGALPYLLLAACPLLHLFMHGGHGGHHGGQTSPRPRDGAG